MSSLIVDQALIDINENEDDQEEKDTEYKLDVSKFMQNRKIDDLVFIKVKNNTDRNGNNNRLSRVERLDSRNQFIRQLQESKSRLSIRNEYAAIYVKQHKIKHTRYKTKQSESDTEADLDTSFQALKSKNSSFNSPSDALTDLNVQQKIMPFSAVEKWSSRINKSTGSLVLDDTKTTKTHKKNMFKPLAKTFSTNLTTTVERENTKDSVLASYDKLIDSFRDLISTPHAYSQINEDLNKSTKMDETLRSEMQTPNDYVIINPTRSISLYSKLSNAPPPPPPAILAAPVKQIVKQQQQIVVSKVRRNTSLNNSVTEVIDTPTDDKEQSQVDETQNKENIVNIKASFEKPTHANKKFLSFTSTKKPLFESTPRLDDSFAFNTSVEVVPTLVGSKTKAVIVSKKFPIKLDVKSKIQTTNNSFSPRKPTVKKKFNEAVDKKAKFDPNHCEIKEFKHCIITDLKIGEGEFGETFQGYRYDLGAPIKIAAKRLKNLKLSGGGTKQTTDENILAEVCVLSQLGVHDFVIGYLGVHTLDDTTYMVFEYAEKGDLKRILDNARKSSKPELNVNSQWKMKFACEIASGMQYISEMGIVHKDLAARNVLLNKDYTCKIADFGCCKSDFLARRPIRWMSPESINKHLYTTASDVWAYGIVLWEIWTLGITPYPGMTDDEVMSRINQWYRLYKPHECPTEVYAIMTACWKEFYRARPRFTQIYHRLSELQYDIIDV